MIKLKGIPRMYVSSPNGTVVMGCELSVRVSKDQLNDCLQKIQHAHALIGKVVKIDEWNEAHLAANTVPEFEIIQSYDETYESIANNHLKDEWKLEKAFVKFIINDLPANNCQIIVSCSHAICDGLSLVYLLEDIAAYFARGIIPDENIVSTLHPGALKTKHSFLPVRLFAFLMNKKLKNGRFRLSEEILSQIHRIYWKSHRTEIELLTFDENETGKIVAAAKANKVSVNTYITYLLHQSQLQLPARPFQNEVIISINLRDKIATNPKRQLGYFVTAVRLNLLKFSSALSSGVLQKLQKTIESRLRPKTISRSLSAYFLSPLFLDMVQLNKFGLRNDQTIQKFIAKKGARDIKTAIAFTNLGVLKVNEDCKDVLKRFLPLVLVSDTIEKYVSAFTYNGQLHMAVCYDPSLTSQNDIDIFKASLKRKLLSQTN